MLITPEQIRAARALLRLEQDDLARRAARLKDAPPFTEDDLYDENGLPV